MPRKITWIGLNLLAAFVVAAGFAGNSASFALMLGGIWVLIVGCLRYKKAAVRKEGFRYNLAACAIPCLVPLGLGTAAYVLLAAYISVFGNSLGVGHLIAMQRLFEKTSGFFDRYVELNAAEVMALLIVGYLLSCAVLTARRGKTERIAAPPDGWMRARIWLVTTVSREFGRYGKLAGPIGTVLATLAAFTFFGTQLGQPTRDLRLRVEPIQKGYAEIAKQVRADVSEHVAGALYIKINKSFPASYRAAFPLVTRIEDVAGQIDFDGGHLTVEIVTNDSEARTVDREVSESKRSEAAQADWEIDGSPQAPAPDGNVTYDQAETAVSKLSDRQKKAIKVIDDGPKEIVLHVEDVISENILSLVKPLLTAIPLTEPLLQAFSGALDETIQKKVEKLIDRFTREAVDHPADLDHRIETAADQLVAGTDVSAVVRQAVPLAEHETKSTRRTLSDLTTVSSQIDRITNEAEAGTGRLDPLVLPPYEPQYPGLDPSDLLPPNFEEQPPSYSPDPEPPPDGPIDPFLP